MRLILVGSSRSILSVRLCRAATAAAAERGDLELVGVVDTAPPGASRARLVAGEALAAAVKPLFGTPHPVGRALALARGMPRRAIRPPGGDPGSAALLRQLERSLRPDAVLWLGSVAVASPELLGLVGRAVNYHNGELPGLRGLAATAWSVYLGHPTTGFSFHVMEERVDAGPVLVAGTLKVPPTATGHDLERQKTELAVAALPRVLDTLVEGVPGVPQRGPSQAFGRRELAAVTTVADPGLVRWDDLARRLRAFGRVTVTIAGEPVGVTAARPAAGGRVAFTTADGVAVEVTRARWLPLPVYRAGRYAVGVTRSVRPR